MNMLSIVYLYVDDLIFTRNNSKIFEDFNQAMIKKFEMTCIGLITYQLEIEVKRKRQNLYE